MKIYSMQRVHIAFIISRTPADVETQHDRYECNITSYPPTNRIMQLVKQVAIELERTSVLIFSSLTTSGIYSAD